ncbi:MAG TPA: putative LPS assembly protein LptD [Flavitalea sp.]|nr:putative LPS assembly protein LptD [Flavitalea sp.]
MPLLILITVTTAANYNPSTHFRKTLTQILDTVPLKPIKDSISRDSLPSVTDTIPTDSTFQQIDTLSVPLSKDSLDSPVSYSASDSMVLSVPDKKITLYSQANVKQDDMDLSADSIEYNQSTNMLVATFRRDSTGQVIGKPKMIQGESNMESDVIRFNMKTQKGITENTVTQQGEIFIQGEKVKKISVTDFYAYRGQFTTCNLDTPHFAFRTKKLKLVNQKIAVSGPLHAEFEGVPVPIYLPFGFFPISSGRHSGFLPPQFTASEQYGLGLQGLGYYKVLNENFDVTLRSDIYSYGGWAAYFTPSYYKRYRYRGAMNLTLQKTKILSDDPKEEFNTTKTFNITWTHSSDSKARPGTNFSANVNAGSTKFNKYVVNNPVTNYSNQLNSSINYSKIWDGKYNLSTSLNHNQNNNTGLINLNLPTVSFTANTIYPFQKKDFVGQPKWYEKLGIGLNSNIANQVSFYDSLFSFSRILDTMIWGAQHNIPIQMALPPMGPVQIAPGISYAERWYSRKLTRSWNEARKKVDSSYEKGFFTARDIAFSLSTSTALFGTYNKFGPNSKVRAIRHVIRPTMSFSYKPDLAKQDYYRTIVDTTRREQNFSYYDGNIYGEFSQGKFGGISFGIDNNLEMKVKSKTDSTAGGFKKVRLIDGFGINGSYNLMADSFNLSNMNLYLRSTLFENVNITASALIDPYQVDERGHPVNKYAWNGDKFSLGQITSGNVAISTTFKSKEKKEKEKKEDEFVENENLPPMTMEEQMAQLQYIRQNPAEFADFDIPWSVSLSYSLNFYRRLKSDYSGYETQVNSNLSWNGDFNLTQRWKMGMNGYYDFKTSSIQTLTMFISREMHCWQLSINVTPVGLYRSFNITINPKSGLLRDLKINRTRYFYAQ